jgi:hypothetical protein
MLPRRLTRAIVKRTFPLAPSEGSGGRYWDVSGDILTTQFMGIPKVHLVAGPGFKRDISTSTTVNTTNRCRVLLSTMVGAFMTVPLAWVRIPFSIIAIIALSTFKTVFAFMALSGGHYPEALLAIGLSIQDIC